MANTHIEVTGSTPRLNVQLRYVVDALAQAIDNAEKLQATLLSFNGDFTAMGGALGLSAADAEAAYTILASSVTSELRGPFTTQLLSRLG